MDSLRRYLTQSLVMNAIELFINESSLLPRRFVCRGVRLV